MLWKEKVCRRELTGYKVRWELMWMKGGVWGCIHRHVPRVKTTVLDAKTLHSSFLHCNEVLGLTADIRGSLCKGNIPEMFACMNVIGQHNTLMDEDSTFLLHKILSFCTTISGCLMLMNLWMDFFICFWFFANFIFSWVFSSYFSRSNQNNKNMRAWVWTPWKQQHLRKSSM